MRARIQRAALWFSAFCFAALTYEWHDAAHFEWLLPLGLLAFVVSMLR